MSVTMKQTALAPWYGGKRTLAGDIVAEFGAHRAYWEPFCGSMAVLFAKEQSGTEIANDLHGDLVNLARCVQDESTAIELYRRLDRFIMCETLFREAKERMRDQWRVDSDAKANVDRAADYFVLSWFGMNGLAGSKAYHSSFAVRFTQTGGDPACRFANAVQSIPAWHRRLARVLILNRDAFEMLERIEDAAGTVIYCDPPYLKKGAEYVHDLSDADHGRLAELLRRFRKTRVLVSYYDDPRLAELYPDWTKRQFEVCKSLVAGGRRDKDNPVVAVECVLINGPSFVESTEACLF